MKCVLTLTRWKAADSRGVTCSWSAARRTIVSAVDTPDYLCSSRVFSDPLGVYLKDSALLTGLFKCPDTLGQDLSTGRAGSHPGGPVLLAVHTHWKKSFPLLRIRTDQNLWKELAQNHRAGTQCVCSFKKCFRWQLQRWLASCQLESFCSPSTRMREI